MHVASRSRNRLSKGGRIAIATSALPAMLLLCAFVKPQLPQTIYDGTHYSMLIKAYQGAYQRVGMTRMTVVTENVSKAADGTVFATKTYTFACPPTSGDHPESCSTTFSISSSVRNDICRDCRITRTSYSGDLAADRKAIAEILRVLGKSAPTVSGS